MKTVLDSSAWVTYFENPSSLTLEKYLKDPQNILVPAIVIYEVYRHLSKKIGGEEAVTYVAQMQEGRVVPLDSELALYAAELSLTQNLGMADALIYATTLLHVATLVSYDNDFRNLPQCVVLS